MNNSGETSTESARRHMELIERIPDGIYRSTPEGRFLMVNSAMVSILGYASKAELMNLHIPTEVYFDPRDREVARERLEKTEKNFSIIRLRRKDGSEVRVEDHGYIVRDANGHPLYFEGVIRDISDRQIAEKQLNEQVHFLQGLIDSLPNPVCFQNLDGLTIGCNKAFITFLGRTREEILGRDVGDFVPEKLAKKLRGMDQGLMERGGRLSFETSLEYANHTAHDVIIHKSAFQNSHGKVEGIICMFHDISRRKHVERALVKSEERYRDLFDNAPDMYVMLSPHGTIIDFNYRGRMQTGYEESEVLGKPLTRFIHYEDLHRAQRALESMYGSSAPPKNLELRFVSHSGKHIWLSVEFSLQKTLESELQAIRMVGRDITDRKRMESELARSQRLETAGKVAGQIAHDFNNLLAPLTAYPTLIREDLRLGQPIADMIDEMETAANQIAEINQQLLALGRRGHYSMAPVNLNELVKRVLGALSLPVEIVIENDLNEKLLLIKGGQSQLTRALTNLILNAKEAMQNIGTLKISTRNIYLEEPLKGYRTIESGEYVLLTITDNGTGIESDILNRIFEPFFTTKAMDRLRGSGLGLSVVHGIVEDHGGYITVDTLLGQGTTFSLYFPITREEPVLKNNGELSAQSGDERILVVDDDPTQRKVATQLLKRLGYTVKTASSGEDAVEIMKRQEFDLMLLDMVMDGIDGAETFRQIRETKPKQKAIILSGFALTQRVEEILKGGAASFISKPLVLHDLATGIRNLLDNHLAEA
jgi:PAS domain S-box-containing protein